MKTTDLKPVLIHFTYCFCICLQLSPQGCAECLSVPLPPPDRSDQSQPLLGRSGIGKLALFPCPTTSPPSPCQPPSPEEAPNHQLTTNFEASHRSSSVPSVRPVMRHIGTQAYVFPETLPSLLPTCSQFVPLSPPKCPS